EVPDPFIERVDRTAQPQQKSHPILPKCGARLAPVHNMKMPGIAAPGLIAKNSQSRGPSAHGLDPWGKPGPMVQRLRHRIGGSRRSPGMRIFRLLTRSFNASGLRSLYSTLVPE